MRPVKSTRQRRCFEHGRANSMVDENRIGAGNHTAPAKTKEEQNELAQHCRLSALGKDLKIEILTVIDLFDLPALLRYFPGLPGSFKEVYLQHKTEIHKAILNQRFLEEWRFIAPDGAEWDPLAPIPHAYHMRIQMVILREKPPAQIGKDRGMDQIYDLWAGPSQKRSKLDRFKTVVASASTFLTFLQNVETQVSVTEREIMKAWRARFQKTDVMKKTWILPWAERYLHRTLLVLWKVNFPDHMKEGDFSSAEYTSKWNGKLGRLTSDERNLLVQLSEAMAIWHRGQPEANIAPEAPTTLTPAGWMYRQTFLVSSDPPFGDLETYFGDKNKRTTQRYFPKRK